MQAASQSLSPWTIDCRKQIGSTVTRANVRSSNSSSSTRDRKSPITVRLYQALFRETAQRLANDAQADLVAQAEGFCPQLLASRELT